MAASALAAPPASRGSVEASIQRPPHWPPMCPSVHYPIPPSWCSDNHPNHLRGGPSSGFSFKTCVATKKQPTLAVTTRQQEKQYNHDHGSLIRNPKTIFIWLRSYFSNRIIEMVSVIIFIKIFISSNTIVTHQLATIKYHHQYSFTSFKFIISLFG